MLPIAFQKIYKFSMPSTIFLIKTKIIVGKNNTKVPFLQIENCLLNWLPPLNNLLIDFNSMSSSVNHQVIQIEDQGDKDYSVTKNVPRTPSQPPKLFKHSAFPRLSSILQKHLQKQAKVGKQEEKQQELVINVMPNTNDEIEVTHIIGVMPTNQDGDQIEKNQNDKMVQQEQKQQFHQETDLTLNQDNEPILMIVEDAQPIVTLCQTMSRQPEYQPVPIIQIQEEAKQALEEPQANASQFESQLQNIQTVQQIEQKQIINKGQSLKQAPKEQSQLFNYLCGSNFICQPMEIQQNKQIVKNSINVVQQLNHLPQQNHANEQSLSFDIQKDSKRLQILQQEQIQRKNKINENIQKMKMKIIDFLPELASTLNFVNDEQVINIYQSIEQKIKNKESETLVRFINPEQKQILQQPKQYKQCLNEAAEHAISSQIPEQQIICHQNINNPICIDEVPQSTENSNEVIKINISVQPIDKQYQNKTSPNPQSNIQFKQQFQFLCNFFSLFEFINLQSIEGLQQRIIPFFPNHQQELLMINNQKLKEILKLTLDQSIKLLMPSHQNKEVYLSEKLNDIQLQVGGELQKTMTKKIDLIEQFQNQNISAIALRKCMIQSLPNHTEQITIKKDCELNQIFLLTLEFFQNTVKKQALNQKQRLSSLQQETTIPQTNSDPQSFNNTVKQFQELKNVRIEDLREKMIQYFPDNKQELQLMNHQQLKGILNQAMEQFEKQTREVTNIQKQPISNSVNQIQQKQTVSINTPNQRFINPPIMMPTEQQNQSSFDSKTKDQIDVDADLIQITPSLVEMKTELLNLLPNLRNEIQCMIDERDIKQLYHQAKKNNLIARENKKQPPKKIARPANPKSLSYNEILKICVEKFPNLKDQIKKLSEQKIRKIYEQIQSKIAFNSKTVNSKTPSTDLLNHTDQYQIDKQQTPLKRTYDVMMASNKKVIEQARPPQLQDKNNIRRKSKVNISEIRQKLITKFPHLKERIMQIDDLEIEKIYFESINTNISPAPQNKPAAREEKPKSTQNQKQIAPQILATNNNESVLNGKSSIIESKQGNTQIYDINNQQKSKKCRTIVMVHTEELNSEDEGSDVMHKIFKTEKGIQKKCLCECCKTTDVTDLLKRLVCNLTKK